MSTPKYYQQFFSPQGDRLHDVDKWMLVRYWNDACWHRSIPESTLGLSYLDVGCNVGHYCLRFEQRGGNATGADFDLAGHVNGHGLKFFPAVGDEHIDPPLLAIREMYGASYKVLIGGFDEHGGIIPRLEKVDIVSSLNVVEYMADPRACIKSLFRQAKQRVIVATDVCLDRRSYEPGSIPPLRWVTGIDDLKEWMEWPYVYWLFEVDGDDTPSKMQVFIVATNPQSDLPDIDATPGYFYADLPETERFYRQQNGRHVEGVKSDARYGSYVFQSHYSTNG